MGEVYEYATRNKARNLRAHGQDIRRCENIASTTPAYWDVTYEHRGVNHRIQLATEPGAFIQVNQDGLPRM